ncbi:MAG: sporulation protein [Bacillaceae bacterium G1]|nr:MAG: sporulation protein [Bacillaceae bacterium G1]
MEDRFIVTLVYHFFIAFGILIGGTLTGGLGALLMGQPPMDSMLRLAEQLKLWAIVAAIGGALDAFRILESGVLSGQLSPTIKQLLYIFSAFLGANTGMVIIRWLAGESAS